MWGGCEQPRAGPSHAGGQRAPSADAGRAGVPGGVIRRAGGGAARRSWILKVLEQVTGEPLKWVNPAKVVPLTVTAVQRYLLEDEPCERMVRVPSYCYDVTLSDGVFQEKCFLHPGLNSLVARNVLRAGVEVRVSRVSWQFNEKRLGQGSLCVDNVHCGRVLDGVPLDTPFRNSTHNSVPERPLRGGKSHYLPLWNNEDPYGDIWMTNKGPQLCDLTDTEIVSLTFLETSWQSRSSFPALIVRILQKSKLRYYGKPKKNVIEPYQTFLEVADNSGTMSVIMWDSLCPEWYKCLRVGQVLLLQNYSVKKNYPYRVQPLPVDPEMKQITAIEICLNIQDSPNNITIIPEMLVRPEWRLPKLINRFITRSELDDMPENSICDIVGLLTFVGRIQRIRKRECREDNFSYRWVHVVDGTSDRPFIVELFSTSQPEIFENMHPMTYFMCTQLKVIRKTTQVPHLLYVTTTNESQVSITGPGEEPYSDDTKVKNFIQWIEAKHDSGDIKNTVIGGYYPYPPAPETVEKYISSVKVDTFLTAISEVPRKIKMLRYREQRRIAIQGTIVAIKYIPPRNTTASTSLSEILQIANRPSTFQEAYRSQAQERAGPSYQDAVPSTSQGISATSRSLSPARKIRILGSSHGTLTPVSQPEIFVQGGESDYDPDEASVCSFVQRRSRRSLIEKWESHLLRERKFRLINLLDYSSVHPESDPRKFNLQHRNFLIRQFNSQPSKYIPPEIGDLKLDDFDSARCLGHFEVTILGLNHDIAIAVPFLPMYGSEDVQAAQIDTLLSCMNYSCVYPQALTGNERGPSPKAIAGDVIKAAINLDRTHIICLLDICNLGSENAEVLLHKVYIPENTF